MRATLYFAVPEDMIVPYAAETTEQATHSVRNLQQVLPAPGRPLLAASLRVSGVSHRSACLHKEELGEEAKLIAVDTARLAKSKIWQLWTKEPIVTMPSGSPKG
jgi:hypothetical protein